MRYPFYTLVLLSVVIFSLDTLDVRTSLSEWFFAHSQADIALLLMPNDAELLESIGHYYFGSGAYELDKAERAYGQAIKRDPATLWSYYQLGRIAFVRGDFTEAGVRFEQALEQNPYNKRILYVRGLLYGYQGKLDKAESDFREFIAWAPTEWGAYNDLAWVLAEKGDFEESAYIAELGIVTAQNGDTNAWLWNALGVAQYNLDHFEEALMSFNKAKDFSKYITESEWRDAYSANDPAQTAGALSNFKQDLEENRTRARAEIGG